MGAAPGRERAAAAPTAPNTATPARPRRGRRVARRPTATANPARTAAIPASRTSLSRSPKVRMANSLSHSGVASMADPPTATRGEA